MRPFCSASSDAAASGVVSSATSRGTGGTSISAAALAASMAAFSASIASARSASLLGAAASLRALSAFLSAICLRANASRRAGIVVSVRPFSTVWRTLVIACCTADLRSPGSAIFAVKVFNGSRQPPRISISACPPAQADNIEIAQVPAIAGSVWVASLTACTISAITFGSESIGNDGMGTGSVNGIGLMGIAVAPQLISTNSLSFLPAAIWSEASLPTADSTILTDLAIPSSNRAMSSAWSRPASSLSATMITSRSSSGVQSHRSAGIFAPIGGVTATRQPIRWRPRPAHLQARKPLWCRSRSFRRGTACCPVCSPTEERFCPASGAPSGRRGIRRLRHAGCRTGLPSSGPTRRQYPRWAPRIAINQNPVPDGSQPQRGPVVVVSRTLCHRATAVGFDFLSGSLERIQ